MREISQETQEILKSQKMIGQDKFSYELDIEGFEGYSDIKESIVRTFRSGGFYGDFCIRADGKILATYRIDNKIMLSVVDTEDELLSSNDAVIANEQEFTTITFVSGYERSSVLLKLKNGKILLFVYERGNQTTANHFIKLYISDNGLGNDFVLNQTISSINTIGNTVSINDNGLGKPIQLNSGRVILPAVIPWLYQGYYFKQSCIFYSDDIENWAFKPIKQEMNYAGDRIQGFAVFDNGKIAIMITSITGTGRCYIYESMDEGANWSYIGNIDDPVITSGYGLFSFLSYGNDGYNYMIWQSMLDSAVLYRKKTSDTMTDLDYYRPENWQAVAQLERQFYAGLILIFTPNGTITAVGHTDGKTSAFYGFTREKYSAPLKASSISISKGKGGANSLSLSVDNSNGAINPKNHESPLFGIVGLNKQLIVKQGYGSDLIETFTGMIDSFSMKSWPHTMEISCRDNLKKALDQTITEAGAHTVNFESQPIEHIFGYLCYLAGIETGEIDTTGISISKEFSWQTYADAFQFLADLASFDYGADEYGKIYFKRDYQPDEIFIAYTFEEGLDITSLSYQLEDKDLYYMVIVYGKLGDNVISYTALFPDAAKYNILPQKILKVDATEASTIAELQKIADRSIYLMNSRTAIVNFAAVAVPWLQVGDFIQVNESSSMSAGIYRISSLNLKMTDKDFTMDLQCYYYGDSVDVGTLPEDTATQAGNAALNLIPEMTSNTAPSGVARASSVLTLYDNDYGPWNALNSTSDDLYWNAVSSYGWIEYTFNEKTIIDKYMLKARQALDYNKAMPKNWQFEGFDGEKWIVLDTRSNQTAWQIHEERSFDFTNAIAYAKYRLNVSANNGFYRLQLEQLAMYYRGGA